MRKGKNGKTEIENESPIICCKHKLYDGLTFFKLKFTKEKSRIEEFAKFGKRMFTGKYIRLTIMSNNSMLMTI